jgi:hypothetical protein
MAQTDRTTLYNNNWNENRGNVPKYQSAVNKRGKKINNLYLRGRIRRIVLWTSNPKESSSQGHIIQGTHRTRDASYEGQIIQGAHCTRDTSCKGRGRVVQRKHGTMDVSFKGRIVQEMHLIRDASNKGCLVQGTRHPGTQRLGTSYETCEIGGFVLY